MPDLWGVFDYEVNMFRALNQICQLGLFNQQIQNALVESRLLHVRILCEILLPRKTKDPDDINVKHLLQDFDSPKIKELEKVYGSNKTEGSLCWTLNENQNKMLAGLAAAVEHGRLKVEVIEPPPAPSPSHVSKR